MVEPRIHALNQLKCLLPPQFNEVIFRYGVDESQLPMNGTQAQKAIDVIKLASQQEGESLCGLLDLIAQIAPHSRPKTGIFQAPPLPTYYVERPELSQEVKQRLLGEATRTGTLVISAIYGLGGIGKSTVAAALAHDPEVQSHFPDGIFWATLGQQPDILSFLSTWIQALGDYDFKPINSDSASLQLRTLLADKKALLVVDDVWHPEHVEPFRVAGAGCRVLVTTREAPVSGATRYDLDVMTPEQSLELLTSCLNQELTEVELESAETLAKTVGYLPLALELAASQVRDGISWAELLEDLTAEIADLETLDRWEAEEVSSEAKRKKYSLVASFNLSLRRLPAARLKCFAWLGVLPDDVTITENLAATLWECNLNQGKKTLRYLRQKALLLPGVSSTQGTNYRLHDLLHDLARNLLQSSTTPETASQLPGLGLSIPEAHQQLLARYRQQTTNGLWHTLTDDGYIYNQLIWHLEKAQKIEEIHRLLQEETPEGNNGWYWQCEREGKTANFVKDISRAWAIAEGNFTANRTESISLQCRYALIFTSLNSLASNILPELMAALLEQEFWKPAQALAYVRQSKNSEYQAKGLEKIIEYLPPSLLPEALEVAIAIADEFYRAKALQGLVPHLPDVLPEAVNASRVIRDERYRAEALVGLAPHLPQSFLPQALDAARAIRNELYRADALVGLAPHFSELLLETLEAARAIGEEFFRASALRGLAPHLPELLPEALEVTVAIGSEYPELPKALYELAPHLPQSLLHKALEAARAIGDEKYRAEALVRLVPHLPEVLSEALEAARAIGDEQFLGSALYELAPHLSQSLLHKALEAARAIRDEKSRAEALVGLVPHLPQSLLSEALDAARAIGDEEKRVNALVRLVPHLPEVLPEALDAARAIEDEYLRYSALCSLAPHLPQSLLSEALDAARAIEDEYLRYSALCSLAPHLPEVLLEVLNAARAIRDKYRASALVRLVPYLPQSLLSEALDAARAIGDGDRALALKRLTENLTPSSIDYPLWQKILHTLASLTRPNFLEDLPHLAPLIIKFGGVEALRETVKAVKDISRWWK